MKTRTIELCVLSFILSFAAFNYAATGNVFTPLDLRVFSALQVCTSVFISAFVAISVEGNT
jgi:hypothetical protein